MAESHPAAEDPPAHERLESTLERLARERLAADRKYNEALTALDQDHAFLTQGEVFTEDLIETWISYKRDNEVDPVRLRPTPHEFELYFDC